nr:MBG domain-containing protein [Akkermansiaceae bacterium]
TVTLGNLAQTYDGLPKPVSVTTDPPGLAVAVTYDGSDTPPTEVGEYAVVATVTDPNYLGSASGTLVITMPDYGDWRQAQFDAAQLADGSAEWDADPDGDGVANLMEYGLDSDPNEAGQGPAGEVVEDAQGVARLTLAFIRPAGLPDIEYLVEVAGQLDAAEWTVVNEVEVTPLEGTDSERVVARDPVSADDAGTERRFIRLRVRFKEGGGG